MLKDQIKNIILNSYSKTDNSIIINSYGRSGSTVLTKSILASIVRELPFRKANFVKSSFSREAWDLDSVRLQNGAVYKTHDYPPKVVPSGSFKMLYTFANPIEVVTSIKRLNAEKGMDWINSHLDHLKVVDANIDEIVNQDILELEKHLNTWLKEERFPVMFLNYETMWDYQSEIAEFLGFNFELPRFKQRKSNVDRDEENYSELEETYGSLILRIAELDNCFVINQ